MLHDSALYKFMIDIDIDIDIVMCCILRDIVFREVCIPMLRNNENLSLLQLLQYLS